MNMSLDLNIAATRSPTSSMIAAKSSCFARASPISLTTASSALRCSVSASSRLVSSNRRAFSSATPMLEAIVERRRSSDSVNPCAPGDRNSGGGDDRREAPPDELDDRVEVELLRERRADFVDQRQLRAALLGLGEEALRFVEQARVLQRHAHARGDRREEALVRLAECVRLS